MRSPLAFRPRAAPLQLSSPAAASAYLGAFLLAAFLCSDPLLLAALIAAVALAGRLAGVGAAVRFALRIGVVMALLLILVNGLASSNGATILIRLGQWPLLGHVEVTAEALAAGAVIGLRAVAVMLIASVYSAAVDPDRLLRALRPWLARSALTAGLASRFLPLALADAERIREAARLRGPAAAPVSGPEMARRLLAGTLDRAVEVAATLEIRGYNLPPGPHEPGQLTPAAEAANREKSWVGRRFAALHARRRLAPRMRSRFDRRFWLAGLAVAAATIASWLAGIGAFEAYPSIVYSVAPAQLALAALFCLAGLAPLRREATRG